MSEPRKRATPFQYGFSLVELVVVLLVVSALAVVVIPRLTGNQEFRTLGYFDSVQAAVRYAQKLAVAQRRVVYVSTSASSLQVCHDAACASAVVDPVGTQAFVVTAPAGVSLAGVDISFDGLGRPSAGATFTVTDSDSSRSFVVEPETGYVHH